MKRIFTFVVGLLMAIPLFAQNVTLTFTGRDVNNHFIPLHRVVIMDVTRSWQETIYYPDTIYVTTSVGIEDHNGNLAFELFQNAPNPFDGTTDFTLQVPRTGVVQLEVSNLNGRRIAGCCRNLPAGKHTFRVQLSSPQGYVLNARLGKEKASIKMVNTGNAGTDQIRCLDEGQPLTVQLKSGRGQGFHAFYEGDQMLYIGYVMIEGSEYQCDPIQQQQYASENIVLNFHGTDFGQPCPGAPTLTDYDGNVYRTVKIGRQCWMKENLKTTHYSNGTAISLYQPGSTNSIWFYYPNGDSNNVNTYGCLYSRKAAMKGSSSSASNPSGLQGVCPDGWHVPSEAEWLELEGYVSCQSQNVCGNNIRYIAKALAANSRWNYNSVDCAIGNPQYSNNATGFSALPAGNYSSGYVGYETAFWTATDFPQSSNLVSILFHSDDYLIYHSDDGRLSCSVRCVKDDSTTAVPVVSTAVVTNVAQTTAICGGAVVDDNGAGIIERGVCYATVANPLIADEKVIAQGDLGDFTCAITGLTPTVTYYVRAYVTTNEGTFYGNQESFTTLASYNENDGRPCNRNITITDYDGNVYHTVQMGQQCWMRENMQTKHFSDGSAIGSGYGNVSPTHSLYTPLYYYPNDDSCNVGVYGNLYNWPAVMNMASTSATNPSGVQGICPDGWHVPSDAEWAQLINYVGSQSLYYCGNDSTFIAKALASTSGWNGCTASCAVGNSCESNNLTGFTAAPAGGWVLSSSRLFGDNANYWSATERVESGAYCAYGYFLNTAGTCVTRHSSGHFYKSYGASVRCLRD